MTSPADSRRLQAVLFDWAGTTIDYGSRAPALVFLEIFRRRGVEITEAEARAPMGRAKRDHLAAIAAMPRIAEAWSRIYGQPPRESDLDRMYADFLPLQRATLQEHAHVIPGVVEAVTACRRRGLKIGSTTGYTRELMEIVGPAARAEGYAPDVVITGDDVPQGRPAPWMNLRAAERLGVYPLETVVAVDDTPVGIAAGRHAGMWTVAVAKTGNSLGLSPAEAAALPPEELERRLRTIRQDFLDAGAHYVLDAVADLPGLLDLLESRLARGERPPARAAAHGVVP